MAKATNGHSRIGHNSGIRGAIWLTRSYNCQDEDPECDRFRKILRAEGLKESDIAALAGVGTPTVSRLLEHETRNPRHSTFAKLAGGLGYEYQLVREVKPNFEREIPKAVEQRKLYREQLAKKRERSQPKKG
jgi:transcriptional regulator with XRE-family HTH domain